VEIPSEERVGTIPTLPSLECWYLDGSLDHCLIGWTIVKCSNRPFNVNFEREQKLGEYLR
jgi:hypothetical protein